MCSSSLGKTLQSELVFIIYFWFLCPSTSILLFCLFWTISITVIPLTCFSYLVILAQYISESLHYFFLWWYLQFFPKLHRSLYFYTSICFFSSSILLYYHCKLRQLCSSLLRFLYSLCKWLSRKNLLDQSIKYPPLNTANFSLTWPYKVITKWYYMIFLFSTFQQNSTFPDCSYLKVWFLKRLSIL